MNIQPATALSIIRYAVSGIMISHGVARVLSNGVAPFGEFLGMNGIPFGVVVAGGITAFEILGGLTLLVGKYIKPISLLFICEHIAGITLVHSPHGWFVVGLGRNGMEYSALLILLFATVALSQSKWK